MCKLLSSNKNGHVFTLISNSLPVSRNNVCLWCSRVLDWHMMTGCSRKREAETATGWPPQWYGRKQKTKCLQCALSLYGPTMSTDVLLTFLSGVVVTIKLYWNTNRENYMWTATERTICEHNLRDIKNMEIFSHCRFMIWYVILCYVMLFYDMTRYDMIWHDMLWYDMIWNDMIWYDMIRYNWYMIYDMIWYDKWYDIIYDMICCDMIWYDWYMIYDIIYDMIWYTTWYGMLWLIYDMTWYDRIWIDTIDIWYVPWYDMIWLIYDIWHDMINIWYMTWYDMTYDMIYDMIWYNMIWYDWYMIHAMIWYDIWYDMIWYDIYSLNAVGLTPSGSGTVHIYTQTVHRTTQLILEECRPCPVFASYTLAFALQLRKKQVETSVRVAGECQLARWNRIYRREHT